MARSGPGVCRGAAPPDAVGPFELGLARDGAKEAPDVFLVKMLIINII